MDDRAQGRAREGGRGGGPRRRRAGRGGRDDGLRRRGRAGGARLLDRARGRLRGDLLLRLPAGDRRRRRRSADRPRVRDGALARGARRRGDRPRGGRARRLIARGDKAGLAELRCRP